MALSSTSFPESKSNKPRWLRWTMVAGLTLLLHLSALDWAKRQIGTSTHAPPAILKAELHAAPAEPPLSPAQTPPRKRSPSKQKPKPSTPPSANTVPVQTVAIDNASSLAAATATEPASPLSTGKDDKPAEASHPRYKVALPPSGELTYDVEALLEGQTWNGRGKINWDFNGGNYVIKGEASVLVTILDFGSTGGIDEYGIAPVRYSEKPFRKSEVATHFTRERNTISFSASTISYPIKGGEQDRASIIWQLAGIGRGDREKFIPNGQLPIFVAGVRDGEVWDIRVIGEEAIATGIGQLQTWHLVRLPRPGSYDKKLDIWLAPEREWYPVRLRYTDVNNGEYLDMAVSSMTPSSR